MTIAERSEVSEVFGLEGLPDLLPSDEQNLAGQTDEETGREHLSHSSVSTHLSCLQKYGFSYDLGIEPIVTPEPLAMGRAFQAAIEHNNPEVGITMLVESTRVFDQTDEDKLRVNSIIVGAAAEAYLARWPAPDTSEREFAYRVRLRNPWTGYFSHTFDLTGYADELIEADDGLELVENKLVGQITELDVRRLPLDRQIALSCLGIYRATGQVVKRIRYRWTRKPSIRQRQKESLEQFCKRLQTDYQERRDFYTHEETVYRSEADLVRIEAELWEWAEQLRQARRRRLYPRNTSVCHEYGGCPFIPICVGDPDAKSLYQPKQPREPGS